MTANVTYYKYAMLDENDKRGRFELLEYDTRGNRVGYSSTEDALNGDETELAHFEKVHVEATLNRKLLSPRKAFAREIDQIADAVRAAQMGAGERSIDIEYEMVQREWIQWVADGEVDADLPETIVSWVEAREVMTISREDAITEIRQAIANYEMLIGLIRRKRLMAKALILTVDWHLVISTFEQYRDELNVIRDSLPDVFS